jgi:hypothetical protein
MITNSNQTDINLSNLLKKIIYAQNDRVIDQLSEKILAIFRSNFPWSEFKVTPQFSQLFLCAKQRIKTLDHVPVELSELMERLNAIVVQTFLIDSVLGAHLKVNFGDERLSLSLIDDYLAHTPQTQVSYSDLFFMMTSDWGGTRGGSTRVANLDAFHTFSAVSEMIIQLSVLGVGTQSHVWKKHRLDDAFRQLIENWKRTEVSKSELEDLQKEGTLPLYIPIGYYNCTMFFMHLVVVDYQKTGYRFRLLTCDSSPILAAQSKPDHYCPEVIWEGLTLNQLTKPDLWIPMLEIAHYEEHEKFMISDYDREEDYVAYNSTHLIPWLTRKFNKSPFARYVDIPESTWEWVQKQRYQTKDFLATSFSKVPPRHLQKHLVLAPTKMDIRRPLLDMTMSKFLNLIAKDRLPDYREEQLFKAETRLLMLTAAYETFRNEDYSPDIREKFLKTVRLSWGKVTSPIVALMKSNPNAEQLHAAKILLISTIDLQRRYAEQIAGSDNLNLAVTHHLYPSIHQPHQVDFAEINFTPIRPTILQLMRLNEGVKPLKCVKQWTFEEFPDLFSSLETWYDILLDAKGKCEPSELILMAHRNVFSRLPIPKTNSVEDTFPDQLSEGLQVGTLLILKKITSLIGSEVFADSFVPPLFIADITRAYRFAIELYRQINPKIWNMPVSWYCLHEYLNSRHSFHLPGYVKDTLEELVESFKQISPKGYQRPSKDFEEIPLFYYSWTSLSYNYNFHRKQLGPFRNYEKTTVDEILTVAELADSVGLKPEETANSRQQDSVRWENSFGGQTLLLTKEIAQHYTMSYFSTVEAFRESLDDKNHVEYNLSEHLGPEDYFQLEAVRTDKGIGDWTNNFGGSWGSLKYAEMVVEGSTPMSQRMVKFQDEQIKKFISCIPVKYLGEYRDQAELIKNFKQSHYLFHQAAAGPTKLSIDVLLENFESHPSLLLNSDYRAYFLGILQSGDILETAYRREPYIVERLKLFLIALYNEDRVRLEESNLNYERLLWVTAVIRLVCHINQEMCQKFNGLLNTILTDLLNFARNKAVEEHLVPHVLASQKYVDKKNRLSVVEIARLHLIMGQNPPTNPNDMLLWLEAAEMMMNHAPKIQEALCKGPESMRRELFGLIFKTEQEVNNALSRQPQQLSLSTLIKINMQLERLERKQAYMERWVHIFKVKSWRSNNWREEASNRGLKKVIEDKLPVQEAVIIQSKPLLRSGEEAMAVTDTCFYMQMGGRQITVDWATGRMTGGTNTYSAGKRLPVYLRKHPNFEKLKQILRRPLELDPKTGRMKFQGLDYLTVDVSSGGAWIRHGNQEFRIVPRSQIHSLKLPDAITHSFSVWIAESRDTSTVGVIVAHDAAGVPFPKYTIDQEGSIHMIEGNPSLKMATAGFYSEAQLFNRWGFEQKDLLVWLDGDNNVAEIHIPLDNGENRLTRLIRRNGHEWWMDGLEVTLEASKSAIEAFKGYPVYLIARNAEGHRLMLLPGVSPYKINSRKNNERKRLTVKWDKILLSEIEEKIHQYRLLPSGQVEGLTFADNLLLMHWKLWMSDYTSVAELAKRWLTPPGRPYSKDEQDILMAWIPEGFSSSPMEEEMHPSAVSLRLYVMTRIMRHLTQFPPPGKKGKSLSVFAAKVIGKRHECSENISDIEKNLIDVSVLKKQVRGTQFESLMSIYDHESILRYITRREKFEDKALHRKLSQRLNQIEKDHVEGTTKVTCRIASHRIGEDFGEIQWAQYAFEHLLENYPTKAQSKTIPVDKLSRNSIQTDASHFFDKAYTLIKDGPKDDEEKSELAAILREIENLNGSKSQDVCIHSYMKYMNYYTDQVVQQNLMYWILLREAFNCVKVRNPLPPLPSMQKRFGIALQGSLAQALLFFNQVIAHTGKSLPELLAEYRKEWYNRRKMRYLEQHSHYTKTPYELSDALFSKRSKLLKKEIQRWRKLSAPKSINKDYETGPLLVNWNYPVPSEWAKLTMPQLAPQLNERISFLKGIKAKRASELLALANELPTEESKKLREFANQIHYGAPHHIDECITLALGNQGKFQLEVIHYLEASIELAHLERCKKELEGCLADAQNAERTIQFCQMLMTPHRYRPSLENLPLMISEYYSDCLLRTEPDQAYLIDELCTETKKLGKIIQAIMGSGKSKMLAPMWLRVMLSRGRIPFLCVPSSLFRTTISDLQDMMWKRFKTHVRAFTFEREKCTIDYLYQIAESLYVAQLEPTVFVCSIRDLHAMQLMLKERHQLMDDMRERLKRFTLQWVDTHLSVSERVWVSNDIKANQWDNARYRVPQEHQADFSRWYSSHRKLEEELLPLQKEADLLQPILNLMQFEAAILVDEVANSWDPRNLLSFPIGWQIPANPQAVSVGCKLYFEWLVPFYEQLDLLNNMQSFTKEDVRKEIYQQLAKTAWLEYKEHLPDLPKEEDFSAYLMSDCAKGQPMEALILKLHNHPRVLLRQYAQEISYLKYCLTVGLEGALTATGHVNYGRSIQDPHLYLAIPYQYANVPKENTLFKRPWKTILMTCQLYAQTWSDVNQTIELISFLQGIDPNSKDTRVLEAAVKVWGRRFSDASQADLKEMQFLTDELDKARSVPEKAQSARILISSYLQSCVFPSQLKLDPSQLTSTPQDIPTIAAKTDAMGGTFGFEGTWNPRLGRKPDLSSDETILKALAEPRNQKCHVIPKGGAESLFKFLETGALKELLALIDAGALFKGICNENVARRLYTIYRKFGFDCVLFWDEKQSGGARLAVMSVAGKTILEASDKDGVRRALTQMKLTRSFVFYDQARRIGADLELKDGRAGVTFSDTVTQDDLFQSCMRCRGLIVGRHTVEYLIPAEMEEQWTGLKVVAVAKQQQLLAEGNANFHGVCEQLRGVLRSAFDKSMRSIANVHERHHVLKKAQVFLMEEQGNDLVATFGRLQKMIPSRSALSELKTHLIRTAELILPEKANEIAGTLNEILIWHDKRKTVFPDKVREGETQEDAVQEIDLSKDQDRLRLMEEEYERMLGTRNPKKEIVWEKLDKSLIKPAPLGTPAQGSQMPTLHYLKDVLKERGFAVPLSDEILISANLMTTFIGETNCLLTENRKHAHRVLCVPTWNKPTFVLVSEGDADYLKDHLLKMDPENGKGYFLLEPSGAINQRGSRRDKIFHFWKESPLEIRSWLLQILCYQGSAIAIGNLMRDNPNEVRNALHFWVKKDMERLAAIRVLFETALDLNTEEMMHYRRNRHIRSLFTPK